VGLGNPGLAKRADIVPEQTDSVKSVPTPAGPVAEAERGKVKVDIGVRTRRGVLFLEMKVWNNGDTPIKIKPDSLRLEAEGTSIPPLTPERYVETRYDRLPYPVDEKGEIHSDDSTQTKLNNAEAYKRLEGTGLPQVRGDTRKATAVDSSLKPLFKSSTYQDLHKIRMEITKDWLDLRGDLLHKGGTIAPGAVVTGRQVYQRNGLELPLVVTFQPEGSEEMMRFRFVRQQ
jgi:hypothetical protein